MTTTEYKELYEKGSVKVGLILARTQTGSYQGDSRNIQLEGILSGFRLDWNGKSGRPPTLKGKNVSL